MRTSRRMLKQIRRAMFAAFLFSGGINMLMLVTPLYTLHVFETVVPLGSLETLVILTAIAGAALAALALIEIARDTILLRASIWLDHELGQHILENGVKLGTPAAELARDQQALQRVRSFLASPALHPVFDAPWTPVFLAGLFLLHPMIGAVALAAGLLLIAAAILESVLTSRLVQESAEAHARADRWWSAVARNANLAGALGLARGASGQWEMFNRSHVVSAYSLGKRTSAVRAFSRLVRIGSQIALYGTGAWLVVKGECAPGALVASAILMARALAPLEQLVGSIKAAGPALQAYRRLKALPADAALPSVGGEGAGPLGHLRLNEATVYYPGRNMPALRGATLDLKPGECLGIVGSNGSGKSTLAAVIAGAVIPASGSADLDGVPVAKWQRWDGPPPIGYMPDEATLVDGTVHENIARFREASIMSVAQAAIRAGVHDTLHALPRGYDTHVGHGGLALSLRERRATAFARALHGKPRLVVLDEPEIGLDGQSLRQLMASLEALKRSGTGLVVATQDPRILSLMDNVAVLHAGQIQAVGSPGDVRRRMESARPATGPAAMELN